MYRAPDHFMPVCSHGPSLHIITGTCMLKRALPLHSLLELSSDSARRPALHTNQRLLHFGHSLLAAAAPGTCPLTSYTDALCAVTASCSRVLGVGSEGLSGVGHLHDRLVHERLAPGRRQLPYGIRVRVRGTPAGARHLHARPVHGRLAPGHRQLLLQPRLHLRRGLLAAQLVAALERRLQAPAVRTTLSATRQAPERPEKQNEQAAAAGCRPVGVLMKLCYSLVPECRAWRRDKATSTSSLAGKHASGSDGAKPPAVPAVPHCCRFCALICDNQQTPWMATPEV